MKEYREQIVILLLVISNVRQTELNGQVKSLGGTVLAVEDRIVDEAKQTRTQILEALKNSTSSPNSSENIGIVPRLLSQMVMERSETSNKQAVLDSLSFPRMQDRREYIGEAHRKTFQWIFKDGPTTEQPWANFSDWLKSSTGCTGFLGNKAVVNPR